jgi:sugar phosphate isomerase/epimerase
VEVSTYVLHLWGLATTQIISVLDSPAQRQGIFAALMVPAERSLAQACELVEPQDLCVENLETPPFDVVLPLVEQHGASICLDVGHLAWQGVSPLDFLAQHGDRIREVHLHDAAHISTNPRLIVRDHLPLGQGELDHLAFMHKLKEVGFEGAVILENNSQADLEESLEQLRSFL